MINNTQELMKSLGVRASMAPLAVPYIFMLPSTVDPSATPTVVMVEGLQNGLNRLGAGLKIDGRIGPATMHGLKQVAGTNWSQKTFARLYKDILSAINSGRKIKPYSQTVVVPVAKKKKSSSFPLWGYAVAGLGAWYVFSE